jgi:hypothetical protein
MLPERPLTQEDECEIHWDREQHQSEIDVVTRDDGERDGESHDHRVERGLDRSEKREGQLVETESGRLSSVQEQMPVAGEACERAVLPTCALVEQSLDVASSLGNADRIGRVGKSASPASQLQGEVHVLGLAVVAEAFGLIVGGAPVGVHRARKDEDRVRPRSQAIEVETEHVLERLDSREQASGVAHDDTPDNPLHVRVDEAPHHVADGGLVDRRVGVDVDDDLAARVPNPVVERSTLAAVGLVHQGHAVWNAACDLLHDRLRTVSGTVVDDHHLQVGVVGIEH